MKVRVGHIIAVGAALAFGAPGVQAKDSKGHHSYHHYRHHHHHSRHVASRHGGHLGGGGLTGVASIYSTESGSGTASGQRLNPRALTAAHRSLPFGTKVRVTNKRNGRSVIVTINDRGPFVRGRVIDLTPAGARALGFSGLAPVTLDVVS